MPHTIQDYEGAATDMVLAFNARDAAALARLNAHYGRAFTFDDVAADIWRRVYAFRQRSSRVPVNYLDPAEARSSSPTTRGLGAGQHSPTRRRRMARRCQRSASTRARTGSRRGDISATATGTN
jgi:hypothetical protein